jgi:hypothetical protein
MGGSCRPVPQTPQRGTSRCRRRSRPQHQKRSSHCAPSEGRVGEVAPPPDAAPARPCLIFEIAGIAASTASTDEESLHFPGLLARHCESDLPPCGAAHRAVYPLAFEPNCVSTQGSPHRPSRAWAPWPRSIDQPAELACHVVSQDGDVVGQARNRIGGKSWLITDSE